MASLALHSTRECLGSLVNRRSKPSMDAFTTISTDDEGGGEDEDGERAAAAR